MYEKKYRRNEVNVPTELAVPEFDKKLVIVGKDAPIPQEIIKCRNRAAEKITYTLLDAAVAGKHNKIGSAI
jgi:hypothetical protein